MMYTMHLKFQWLKEKWKQTLHGSLILYQPTNNKIIWLCLIIKICKWLLRSYDELPSLNIPILF